MLSIVEHPSPNHSPRKPGVRVDTVLLHHTATKANATGNAVALATLRDRRPDDPSKRVSAHYVLTTVGAIYRLVTEGRTAWHAGKGRFPWETRASYDFNHRSVGVELVNPGDGKTPFTEAQYMALGELLPDVVGRMAGGLVMLSGGPGGKNSNIARPGAPKGSGIIHVFGHRDVAQPPGRKTDPADNFDWGRVRSLFAGRVA